MGKFFKFIFFDVKYFFVKYKKWFGGITAFLLYWVCFSFLFFAFYTITGNIGDVTFLRFTLDMFIPVLTTVIIGGIFYLIGLFIEYCFGKDE